MSIENLLSTAFMDSVLAINRKLTIDDAQRNVSATYLGANKVQLANGDIRTVYNQGTKEVLIGESVICTFPIHSAIGTYTSKIS
jgi:hypothetical protein